VWDATFDPGCIGVEGAERPGYCDEPWCYVNQTECQMRSTGKTYRETDLIIMGKGKAFYSYETCGGDTAQWTTSLIDSTLRGKTLVAGIPRSFLPENYEVDENGKPINEGSPISTTGAQVAGVWIDVYKAMQEIGGFNLVFVPVSNASLVDHSSAWTACVQDVSNGIVDLCVGNFWVTPERLGLGANFITPATTDTFKLLVKSRNSMPSLAERLWTPFAPFSGSLWCSIGFMWLFVGGMYTIFGTKAEFMRDEAVKEVEKLVERRRRSVGPAGNDRSEDLDFRETLSKHITKESSAYWVVHALNKDNSLKFAKLVYFAMMEFFSASVAYEGSDGIDKSKGLRVIKTGYAFFVIVAISCYVGNMAAMRTVVAGIVNIRSVEDCAADSSCKMCIHSVTERYFRETYPSLRTHLSSSSKGLLEDLLDEKCTVGMSQGLHFGALGEDVDVTEICEYKYDVDVYNMYVSQPVKTEYAQALSSLAVQVKDTFYYDELYEKYFTSFDDVCGADESDEETVEEVDQSFELEDFGGLYFIVVCFFVVAIAVDYFEHRQQRLVFLERQVEQRQAQRRQSSMEQDDEDGDIVEEEPKEKGSVQMGSAVKSAGR